MSIVWVSPDRVLGRVDLFVAKRGRGCKGEKPSDQRLDGVGIESLVIEPRSAIPWIIERGRIGKVYLVLAQGFGQVFPIKALVVVKSFDAGTICGSARVGHS